MRKDFLSIYGYPFKTAPYLQELLKNAYVFSSARSTSSWTGTAVASLMSGLCPSDHGHFRQFQVYSGPMRINEDKNYYNFCISGNPWLDGKFGFARGWDEHFISDRLLGENLVRRAKDIITNLRCPFLGYMHFMENHEPFGDYWHLAERSIDIKSVERYYQHMLNTSCPVVRISDKLYRFFYKHFSKYGATLRKSLVRHQSKISQNYTNTINYVGSVYKFDCLVSDMVKFLNDKGIANNTILIILSDHGWGFGERTEIDNRHGYNLYNETLNIPLLVYNPNFKNKTLEGGFSIQNVMQIIKNIQTEKSEIIDENMFSEEHIAIIKNGNRVRVGAMVKERYKLLKNYIFETRDGFNLYDDPGEKINVFDAFAEYFSAMEKKLDMEMAKADKNEGELMFYPNALE